MADLVCANCGHVGLARDRAKGLGKAGRLLLWIGGSSPYSLGGAPGIKATPVCAQCDCMELYSLDSEEGRKIRAKFGKLDV